MVINNSFRFKMLRLVFMQAALFGVVLASLWFINPRWVFWHQTEAPMIADSLKQFKQHYGTLNTLNISLANLRLDHQPSPADIGKIGTELHQQIQGIKNVSLTAQQHFKLDFTVLINFLFNYKAKVSLLDPSQAEYERALWDAVLYFSRIQSEFFYIVEEIDRFDSEKSGLELKNAQVSLLIWGSTSLLIVLLGLAVALSYAREWQKQVANLLNQVYRLGADDYSQSSQIQTDDELGFLANAFNESVSRLRQKALDK